MEPRASAKIGFRPEVEGLRALAVLAVVLYHAGVPGFSGGYVGVDVFFVISGYLITGLLFAQEARDGRLDLRDFYARRMRRLVPAGLIVVIATAVMGAAVLEADPRRELMVTGIWTVFYASNLHFIDASVAYFQQRVEQNPLLHTWSLGVEAQFYLIWPLPILASAGRRAWLGPLLATLTAISFLASVLVTRQDLALAYMGLPSRLWELGCGGLLALAPRAPLRGAAGQLVALAGLLLVAGSVALMDKDTPFPGWIAAVPVTGAAALVTGSAEGQAQRLLAWPPLQSVGRLSYGWYLWHWPLITLLPLVAPGAGLAERLAAAGLSLGLAALSYRFVEQPVRRSAWLRAHPNLTLLLGASATVLTGAGLWLALRFV